MATQLRLGTRGSPLALKQAEIVQKKLALPVEIVPIKTSGDKDQKSPLYKIGGKGVFIRELEIALLENKIDIAVHSLKDVTTRLAAGLQLSAFLRAESPCDVLVAKTKIDQLPLGSVIGTSSMRRKALLKKYWPHLLAKDIRGNIETRLKAPGVHGVILSEAGLLRMGYKFSERLDAEKFVPAPGQGVIVLETRADAFAKVAAKINDADQEELSRAELKLAHGFDCSAPLGIYARKIGGKIRIKVFLSNSAMDRFFEEDKDQNQWTTIPSF